MDMRAITASEYETLSPRDKGYACYMQAAWNKAVKDENPYPKGSEEWVQFREGEQVAVIDCIDLEE